MVTFTRTYKARAIWNVYYHDGVITTEEEQV